MVAKSPPKKVRQRFPRENEILSKLEITRLECVSELESARSAFEHYVNPEALYHENPTAEEVNRMNAAFTEWVLFDCDLFDGGTLFEQMAIEDPTLAECAATQFYSRFWVIEQDPKRGRVILRDMATRRDFEVRSPHIARVTHWGSGTLGTRIARSRGIWREIGHMTLHDNAPSTPLPACSGRPRTIQRDAATFIVNVEQVIGHHGVFRDTATSFEL